MSAGSAQAIRALYFAGEDLRASSALLKVPALPTGSTAAGKHSIRISDQWRIVFRWTDAGPEDVEIIDYR